MLAQIVLFDGFDPLDVIAPFEVLAAGADFLAATPDSPAATGSATDGAHSDPATRTGLSPAGGALEVRLVSADGPGPVVSGTLGLALHATAHLDPTRPGFVIVPGASGPTDGDPDEGDVTIPVLLSRFADSPAIERIRTAFADPDVTVATVCGGSLALAMAGLIEGRHAVTHTLGLDVLEATGVRVVRARVVDDGDFVSAGGVTSGLDLGLYLLERAFGPQIAHAVETLFEYERRGVVWRAA
ncbi:DJ-1/PfpI family protein [Dactylosporangium sp. CA-233914]|uniref:DJ-1/PfpI family protein n=1 Tax=Dactylosporangium sp. CA-233914 TaxID=3239934 RepID=UPI003D9169C7